ncbi:MAG: peptide-methionine (S)-S-oxide reductase MsrA [Tannerella sp.]|jgi:peptide methionine sulfoxide reductase msrA/msrB|nr:peptide-methionine (S)-S-oxide reductase MsrA [Tannerella sp.]
MEKNKSYFASGCFWGTEYHFMKATGVVATAAGFMGGHVDAPAYQDVRTGETGHLECVEVEYDATETTYENLVKLFFETHDFTQTDGQGPDIGSQYLSCLFYGNGGEKDTAEKYIRLLESRGYRVATRLQPVSVFWKAEDFHQQYYEHKGAEPYCHVYRKIF